MYIDAALFYFFHGEKSLCGHPNDPGITTPTRVWDTDFQIDLPSYILS